MPGIDFDRLRTQITMEQVLNLLGFQPSRRTGCQWYGPCPLHDSTSRRRRSFSVNVAIGRYYCHRCHTTPVTGNDGSGQISLDGPSDSNRGPLFGQQVRAT